MDRLPTFRTLFCVPIETATIIVAYIHLMIFGIIFFIYFGYHSIQEIQSTTNNNILRVTTVIMTNMMRENALLISAFFAAALLFGIKKKNSDLVLSWLLLQVSSILISLLTLPFTLIPHLININYVLINLQVIAYIGIKSLSLLIVNSYYSTLSRGNLLSEEEDSA